MIIFITAQTADAQKKTEKIDVSGNCGMCKKTIEAAALKAGAKDAVWDNTTKVLAVKYDAKATDAKKIQQSVAASGYDTRDVRADDTAYGQLHACCKYNRTKTYAATGK